MRIAGGGVRSWEVHRLAGVERSGRIQPAQRASTDHRRLYVAGPPAGWRRKLFATAHAREESRRKRPSSHRLPSLTWRRRQDPRVITRANGVAA